MKYKTLFRMSLKVIGVYLCALSIPHFVMGVVQVLASYSLQTAGGAGFGGMSLWSSMWLAMSSMLISPAITIVIGLYLFFRGEWIVNKAIPSNRPYCHQCGYDLSGAVTNRCPECDAPFNPEDVKPSRLTDE